MDSRDSIHPHHPHHHHHHPGMVVVGSTPPAYLSPGNSSHGVMSSGGGGNSGGGLMQPGFPFNSLSDQHHHQHQQHQHHQQHHHPGLESGGVFRGSGGSSGFSIESERKKRGRPRKYTPEGNIALGLGPSGSGGGGGGGGGHFDGMNTPGSGDIPVKKHRGRPPGVGKKQLNALGAGGIGFTPHVILVKAGEDIASKITSFTQQGPRTVCILSANGAVSNVTLRQPAMSVGTVSYEGRFEIISISGSFLFSEDDGNRSRNESISVSLAGSDGRVVGGIVAGMLIAAGPVQVIVGSFIADGKKLKSSAVKSEPSSFTGQGQGLNSQMSNFSAAAAAAAGSPSSHGGSGDSSDENGDSPVNRHSSGLFNDPRQQSGHGIPMYHHLWAGQASQ
ncbi:hypothetical protein MLD38_018339 [Melastoma candidum]|uniref:Uncharacterized protein n=1 Tax=Melastoma candidum TaxID=119954 RepID=A0ACB9QXK5_9MYRT|nr:hypothetical protein MLD38_018339 [Melastoma candidum]